MRRVCVFCGSSPGRDPRYAEAARALARGLVSRGIGVVFGGGSIGLMGVLADQALAVGGSVVGVIPHGLAARELAHRGVADMRVVATMHARKALMAELADGFVALPGGIGTFEELLEIATWGQLGIHRKPIGILNVAGYYDPLVALARPRRGRGLRLGGEPRAPERGRRPSPPSRPHGGARAPARAVVDHAGRSLIARSAVSREPAQRSSAAGASAPAVSAGPRRRTAPASRAAAGADGTTTGPVSGGVRRIGIV